MDETPKDAWDRLREAIRGGVLPDHNGDLLPKNVEQTDRIILLELARETAIADGMGLDPLRPYHDFAKWSGDRRPDPTPGQWQWLYRNIGVRHPFLSVDKVVGMMAGRDALLPFLRSAPDVSLDFRSCPSTLTILFVPSSTVTLPASSEITACPFGRLTSNNSSTRGRPCVISPFVATPPVWNVLIVN